VRSISRTVTLLAPSFLAIIVAASIIFTDISSDISFVFSCNDFTSEFSAHCVLKYYTTFWAICQGDFRIYRKFISEHLFLLEKKLAKGYNIIIKEQGR
jgi:hypothetical protein